MLPFHLLGRDHLKTRWGQADIADVTNFVMPGTPLDEEAAQRGTSTYLVERRIDMLPKPLTEGTPPPLPLPLPKPLTEGTSPPLPFPCPSLSLKVHRPPCPLPPDTASNPLPFPSPCLGTPCPWLPLPFEAQCHPADYHTDQSRQPCSVKRTVPAQCLPLVHPCSPMQTLNLCPMLGGAWGAWGACADICSLRADVERVAFSVIWVRPWYTPLTGTPLS